MASPVTHLHEPPSRHRVWIWLWLSKTLRVGRTDGEGMTRSHPLEAQWRLSGSLVCSDRAKLLGSTCAAFPPEPRSFRWRTCRRPSSEGDPFSTAHHTSLR